MIAARAATQSSVGAVSVAGVAWLIAAAAAAAHPPLRCGHTLLVDRPGVRVYRPASYARAPCPQLLRLPADARAIVRRAVRLAMPPFEKQIHLWGYVH